MPPPPCSVAKTDEPSGWRQAHRLGLGALPAQQPLETAEAHAVLGRQLVLRRGAGRTARRSLPEQPSEIVGQVQTVRIPSQDLHPETAGQSPTTDTGWSGLDRLTV